MTNEFFNYLIATLLDNAEDALEDCKRDHSDFNTGHLMAYYEVLDTIKNRLIIEDYDLSSCGLDIDLDKWHSSQFH